MTTLHYIEKAVLKYNVLFSPFEIKLICVILALPSPWWFRRLEGKDMLNRETLNRWYDLISPVDSEVSRSVAQVPAKFIYSVSSWRCTGWCEESRVESRGRRTIAVSSTSCSPNNAERWDARIREPSSWMRKIQLVPRETSSARMRRGVSRLRERSRVSLALLRGRNRLSLEEFPSSARCCPWWWPAARRNCTSTWTGGIGNWARSSEKRSDHCGLSSSIRPTNFARSSCDSRVLRRKIFCRKPGGCTTRCGRSAEDCSSCMHNVLLLTSIKRPVEL